MKTETGEIVWNVGLKKIAEKTYKLFLPNKNTGELATITGDGFLISWPLNPWFTGPSGIATILQSYREFTDANFIVS